MRVEDTEAGVQQDQEDTRKAGNVELTIREPNQTFPEVMVAIEDSLSNHASSNDGENREDEVDEETEQGQLSKDDEPGWVVGTMSKTIQQRVKRFWQKQMILDEVTQPGWEDPADSFCERDKNYRTLELRVLAVGKPDTENDAASPALISFGEHLKWLDIDPGISQIPQGTFRPGSSYIRLGSGRPQSNTGIPRPAPATEPDSSHLQNAKPVEVGCFYPSK